jgi:hypothetical protein
MQINDKQTLPIGVTPKDRDGKVLKALPAGAMITFTSSNPAVAGVQARDGDPFNVDITSTDIGTATITVHVDGMTRKDGSPVPDETLDLEVINSEPDSLNLLAGEPVEES